MYLLNKPVAAQSASLTFKFEHWKPRKESSAFPLPQTIEHSSCNADRRALCSLLVPFITSQIQVDIAGGDSQKLKD